MSKVLILEDEESIRSFIVINLKRNGFEVLEAADGHEALHKLSTIHDIDIALLDVMVPGIDGFEVCRRIRETNERLGIIFLTAKVQEQDKVYALSVGADDHVSKPFSPTELIARIQSLLRRVNVHREQSAKVSFQSGPFTLDLISKQFKRSGKRLSLRLLSSRWCSSSWRRRIRRSAVIPCSIMSGARNIWGTLRSLTSISAACAKKSRTIHRSLNSCRRCGGTAINGKVRYNDQEGDAQTDRTALYISSLCSASPR